MRTKSNKGARHTPLWCTKANIGDSSKFKDNIDASD